MLGDLALEAGAKGILFPSVLTPGTNLVVYTEQLDATDTLSVYDPDGGLPRDQSSWA